MKKRCFALLLAAVLLLSATAFAEDAAVRVFDYAGLFTAQQAGALEAAIADFQAATGYDFAILVSDIDHGYDDYQQLSDDFYEVKGLGQGMNHSAMLCILDLYEGVYYFVSPYGDFRYLMMPEDVQYLATTMSNYIYDNDLVGGFLWTMNLIRRAAAERGVMYPALRVYDYAQALTDEQIETLEAAIAEFRELSGRDFLYLSTDEEMDGNQDGDFGNEFYVNHGFGDGEERSGVMLYLDFLTENYFITNFGDMDSFVSQQSRDMIYEDSKHLMAEGEVLPAVLQVLDDYAAYFR